MSSSPPTAIRIAILGTPESPYVADLQRAAAGFPDVQLEHVRYADLQAGIDAGAEPVDQNWDAVIVRSMPLGSLEQVIFRMDCLQVLESRGVAVFNSPRSLEVAIDKWLTLHRLQLAGVAVPPTLACQTRDAAMQAYSALGGDVLLKPLFGGEGRGIVRLQDKDTAWRVLGTLQQVGQVLYLQQFVDHFGYDIRVLFVGQRVFSIKRFAVGDSWRTNLALGSKAECYLPSEQELELARRAADAVGGSIVGVDLLPCRDGRLLTLEVNAVPGWRGLGKALDVDIATEVVSYVRDQSRMR